jgi:hypothetical protein
MSKGYDSISAALGTTFVKQTEELPVLATVKEREVVAVVREYKEAVIQTKEIIDKNFSEDYDFIRETLKDLMINGKDALVVATDLAEATESPRAYEVCTSIITTIAGLGKELVNLHKDAAKMISTQTETNIVAENVTNVQNNYYSPNPKELQSILDQVEEVEYDDEDLK